MNIFTGTSQATKEPPLEVTTNARLLVGLTGVYERCVHLFEKIEHKLEARRFDPGPRNEPDYERILREREGFNINDYHEGPKEPSWRDWLMNILGGLIVVGIGAVIYQLEDLKSSMAASLARQEMDDRRIDRLEQRVYRGSP
jgi:hypothetical protein